jgi:hypothetical protein
VDSGDVITFGRNRPYCTYGERPQHHRRHEVAAPARQATFEVDGNSLTLTESDGSDSVYERG